MTAQQPEGWDQQPWAQQPPPMPEGQVPNGEAGGKPEPDGPELRERLLRLAVAQIVESEDGLTVAAETVGNHLEYDLGWTRADARRLASEVTGKAGALSWEDQLGHYRAWREDRSMLPSADQRRQARLQALEDAEWARQKMRERDRQPVVLLTAAEVWDSPDLSWLVDLLIPETGIGTIFSATGTWKSFLALHLMLCIRAGLGFLGRRVSRRGWCFYLLGEGQAGARRRMRAGVADLPGPDGPPDGLAYCMVPFPLADPGAVTDFITGAQEAAGDDPVALVVLDAAADFYGADANENSATDMNPLIASAKRISRELGCFVLLVAHSGYEGGHVRGTSRFGQAWDFEAESVPDAVLPRCGWLRVTKVKEGEKDIAIPFSLVRLAPDPGSPDSASLAVRWPHPEGAAAAALAAEAADDEDRRLTGTEQRVWQDIIRYLHDHGSADKPLAFRRISKGVQGREATIRQMLDYLVRNGLAEEAERSGYPAYFLPLGEPPYRLPVPGGMAEWRPWEPRDKQWAVIDADGNETLSDGR
jgi:AAA domain